MNVDPKSKAVTNFFMVAAVIVMLALAWSVARDGENDEINSAEPVTAEQ